MNGSCSISSSWRLSKADPRTASDGVQTPSVACFPNGADPAAGLPLLGSSLRIAFREPERSMGAGPRNPRARRRFLSVTRSDAATGRSRGDRSRNWHTATLGASRSELGMRSVTMHEGVTPGAHRSLGVDWKRVEQWMDRNGVFGGPIGSIRPITGCTQNLMYRFERGDRAFVLQRPPLHKPARSDDAMRREMRIAGIRAVWGAVYVRVDLGRRWIPPSSLSRRLFAISAVVAVHDRGMVSGTCIQQFITGVTSANTPQMALTSSRPVQARTSFSGIG